MNSTQVVIAVGFTTLSLISVAIWIRILRSTSERERRTPADLERIKDNENRYAIGVVIALVALMAVTVFAIPYDETEAEGTQVVEVSAFQFGWQLTPNTVRAGDEVEFRAHSRDVQHGFGIYKGHELIAQVQVPANRPDSESDRGDEQRIVRTFDDPGTYEVLCLEFCGVKHHDMRATFEVTE